MEFLKAVGDWASSPIGIGILAIAALTGFSIWKFWLQINQFFLKLIGPFVRSVKKEPQRLIAKINLYPQALNDEGLSLIGSLERKSSDPIIYPTVKFKTSDKSLVLNDCVPPMSDKRLIFPIAIISHEDIERIKTDGSKIEAKFSCLDDLVEAKINLCEIDLKKAIEAHEIDSLLEIKKIFRNMGEYEAADLDSFEAIKENFNSRFESKLDIPDDVFNFLLMVRKHEVRYRESLRR